MIRLIPLSLKPRFATSLRRWQTAIDALPAYQDRVAEAKKQFSAKNTTRNATFKHVKEVLTQMCQGARRCGYCEDSWADEVEHIRPKDLYPEAVFDWNNYLYACGPCNGPKNNQFAILHGSPLALHHVTRAQSAAIVPPLAGPFALIDPRIRYGAK